MRTRLSGAVVLALVTGVLGFVAAGTVGADNRPVGVRLIVHPSSPLTTLEQKVIADAFLKKITRWPNDVPIRPVDLHPDSPARRRFSDEVLHRSVAAVKSYWQQLVFSGRQIPPPELETEEQVVRYVLKNPGAIGYVSPGANIEGAKPLLLR